VYCHTLFFIYTLDGQNSHFYSFFFFFRLSCAPVVFFTLCILLSFVLVFGSSVDVNDSGLYPACKDGDASCRIDSNINGSGYCCPIGDDAEANWMQPNPTVMCRGKGKCMGSSSSSTSTTSVVSPTPSVSTSSSTLSPRAKNQVLYPNLKCYGDFDKGKLSLKAGATQTFTSPTSCPAGQKPALTLIEVAALNGIDNAYIQIRDASNNQFPGATTPCHSGVWSGVGEGLASMGPKPGVVVSITCARTKGTCHFIHSVTFNCISATNSVKSKSQSAPGSLQPVPAPKPSVPVPIIVPTPTPTPTPAPAPASSPAALQSIKSSPPAIPAPAPAKISLPTTQQSGSAAVAGLSIFNLLLCLIAVISFLVM
jgi:hypothetical protein